MEKRLAELSERVQVLQAEKEIADMRESNLRGDNHALRESLQHVRVMPVPAGPITGWPAGGGGGAPGSPTASGGGGAPGAPVRTFAEEQERLQRVYNVAALMMRAMQNCEYPAVTNLLEDSVPVEDLPVICTTRDNNGMTPLHHACRLQARGFVDIFLEHGADVANWFTHAEPHKPAKWTPLLCLADSPIIQGCDSAYAALTDLVVVLLQVMDKKAIAAQTSTGSNFFHLIASRGYEKVVLDILKSFDRGNLPLLDKDFLLDLLNTPTSNGKGVVDTAFKSKTTLALALQKWGAHPLLPPPPKKNKQEEYTSYDWEDGQQGGGGGTWGAASSHGYWNEKPGTGWGSSDSRSSWLQASGRGSGSSGRRRSKGGEGRVGQYDHKVGPAESRGFGMNAHTYVADRANRAGASSSEESESDNSQGPSRRGAPQPQYDRR